MSYIDPFDIVSGKVVQNYRGTFWFKEPGNNMKNNWPVRANLHREDGPALIYNKSKDEEWYKYGKRHREDGPAIINNGHKRYMLYGMRFTKKQYENEIKCIKK